MPKCYVLCFDLSLISHERVFPLTALTSESALLTVNFSFIEVVLLRFVHPDLL